MTVRAAAEAQAHRWCRAPGALRLLLRMTTVLGACAIAAACSGGNKGVADNGRQAGQMPAISLVRVTVTDTFGSPVPGATVTGTLGGSSVSGTTDAGGLALLPVPWPSGDAAVVVELPSFENAVVTAPVTAGGVSAVSVTLDRATTPAGGSLTSDTGGLATVDSGRTRMSFDVELIVVDRNGQPMGALDADDFSLMPCTPDAMRNGDECVAGGDAAYTPVTASPESLQVISPGTAQPFAAVLLMDQSASIVQSDPTGARLFAAKSMLAEVGPDDQVLLAAFAAPPSARIPTPPLSVYLPIRGQTDATSYFGDLDALGSLLGGNTPLYSSVDAVVTQIAGDPAVPAGKVLAVVVFTDGRDNECSDTATCRAARERTIAHALANQVRLFAIGLSDQADTDALGELSRRTGGALLFAQTAEQLTPLYGAMRQLLGQGAATYRLRWTVESGVAGAFPSGRQLLGRVRVVADDSSFEVPFVVPVP